MKRLFSFLFRHDWEYGHSLRTERSGVQCQLHCKTCGSLSSWHQVYDRATYDES